MDTSDIKDILDKLKDHEKRIYSLENIELKKVPKKESVKNIRKRSKARGEDLLPPIQGLVQGGFFEEARVDLDVVSELQRRLLTRKKPLRASVVNVLRRLVREGSLDRAEITRNKKTLIAYQNNS